jgi:hypothetical protein
MRIRAMQLLRHDDRDGAPMMDITRRDLGVSVAQLEADDAIALPDGCPNEIAEIARRRRESQSPDGRMEALEMPAEPGKAPPPGTNGLYKPELGRRLYAGHGEKYYIVSDLSRERPDAALNSPCPRRAGNRRRLQQIDADGGRATHPVHPRRIERHERRHATQYGGNSWSATRTPA